MTHADAEAASRDMLDRVREAAEARLMEDPPAGLVPDESGGDPILYEDGQIQRGGGRAAEHRRH